MPTIECLDERTRLVLEKLDDMYELFTSNHKQLKEMYLRREESVDDRINEFQNEIHGIKLSLAKRDGRDSAALWLGGILVAMLGALANTALMYLLHIKL